MIKRRVHNGLTQPINLLQNNVVDEARRTCASDDEHDLTSYAKVQRPRLIKAADISRMFGKPDNWFSRDRNRKALGLRGFPKPVIRGRWLRTAVEAWLERQGGQTTDGRPLGHKRSWQ